MRTAQIRTETITIPSYPVPPKEELPFFAENRVHQRSSGRPYPNRASVELDHSHTEPRSYTAVCLENDFLEVIVLPEIGGRIFAARDKTTGYDFFYRQHVIKPALIGALGAWISGGVEFNWPYHHRASGFMPCDFSTEQLPDGSVVCWLSEHEPTDRMKSLVGILLRPDAAYLETRVRLCNRTPARHSFLWWENAAVPVNPSYQIFFPPDVNYVSFHYLDSRISYPVAGGGSFNGIDMTQPRDISWHKNTTDATSYFACASKYDFFGGYDHGKQCGVVHIADHHISPGKKLFTWGYNQLSRSWERALTDTDGQYAELMAGVYTDNQPNFSWLEPYETKTFSQYWYPISRIGTPDFANLDCALALGENRLSLQATRDLGRCALQIFAQGEPVFAAELELSAASPVLIDWQRPQGHLTVTLTGPDGAQILRYAQQDNDPLAIPPVKDPLPLPEELSSADALYRAGVHRDQYRDPAVMPDAYWSKALERDPDHVPSLLGMAEYSLRMLHPQQAKRYAERALAQLTRFNERLEEGGPYYLFARILEALGEIDRAYDFYYKASWSGDSVPRAMARLGCIDLRRGDPKAAADHAQRALDRDADHPLAPAVLLLAQCALGLEEEAQRTAARALARDPHNLLILWLSRTPEAFFAPLSSDPAQSVLDLCEDFDAMGQTGQILSLLEGLSRWRPEFMGAMPWYLMAYFSEKAGFSPDAALAAAESAPLGESYPVRPLEAQALRFAHARGSVRAGFLLGCLLYDKRHYEEGAALFEEAVRRQPEDAAACRCLAVARFSHQGQGKEALELMLRALALRPCAQLLYETVILMDKLSCPPQEKLELMQANAALITRDDLFVELAKAYNQARQPEAALKTLAVHDFIPCEGGEHAIADQYMFAHYQRGIARMQRGDYAAALDCFTEALTLPEHLGAGIWNRCKYVPYRHRIAACLDRLGRREEADAIRREILQIPVEFFSNMHLPELPWYQAMAARALGEEQRGCRMMGDALRGWRAALGKTDPGFFATTPFFLSFVDDPAAQRRAQYLYLCALAELFAGRTQAAAAQLAESARLNSDQLFCGLFADLLAEGWTDF